MTEQFFLDYLRRYRPFKPYWNYEDGCVLLGCERLYTATGSRIYADFILQYLSERISPDGRISDYPADLHSMDSFNCGKSLFFASDQTGDPRYEKAFHWLAGQIRSHSRTESGMFWHKGIYPQQVWIDSTFMAGPFYAEYAARTGNDVIFDEIFRWICYIRRNLRDSESGLFYHAVDESRTQIWADPVSGRSRTFWLRGEGWFLMALADIGYLLPDTQQQLKAEAARTLQDALEALLPYRTKSGLFCQVIDRQELPGNYTETSGSLMIAYAILRGVSGRLLPQSLTETGLSILHTVREQKLMQTEEGFVLKDICSSAGLGGQTRRDGTAAYYLSEPVVSNDPKGVGILMMTEAAAAEISKENKQSGGTA